MSTFFSLKIHLHSIKTFDTYDIHPNKAYIYIFLLIVLLKTPYSRHHHRIINQPKIMNYANFFFLAPGLEPCRIQNFSSSCL